MGIGQGRLVPPGKVPEFPVSGNFQDEGQDCGSLFILSSSSQKESKKKNQLSICNKLCYAVGGTPYQVTGCALGFFLQIYLLDVAQVSELSPLGLLHHPKVGETMDSRVGSVSPSVKWDWESLVSCLSESQRMRNKKALESIQKGSLCPRSLSWQGQLTLPCLARATEPGGVGGGVIEWSPL